MQAAAFIQRDDRAEVEARSSDNVGEAEPLVVEFSQRLHRAVMEDKYRTLSACRNHPDIAETVHSALTVTVFAAGNDRTVCPTKCQRPQATAESPLQFYTSGSRDLISLSASNPFFHMLSANSTLPSFPRIMIFVAS